MNLYSLDKSYRQKEWSFMCEQKVLRYDSKEESINYR